MNVSGTGRMRSCIGIIGLALLLGLTSAPAVGAGHKHHNRHHPHRAKSRVFWKLPGRVSEGQAIPFTWKVTGRFGRRYRLVVQRPVGTARVWRTMLRLRTRKGSAELPGQKLGRYRFRLALFRGRRVLAKRVVGIGVFGQVPFSTLFRRSLIRRGFDSGIYAAASSSFPYVVSLYPGEFESPRAAFSVADNHCTAVHIDFILGNSSRDSLKDYASTTGIVAVVQQSRDPVSASSPFDQPGTVDVELVPGQSWSVLASEQTVETVTYFNHIYLNGYAVCNSTESFFS